ncbi:DUF2071 domain-containing protein [Haloarcula pelagica]|uniref:DUF2071 domain-containing protein n=1 Tax=Haloarcula pelagica TaxID=3033389 RepID=UPI0024C44478|nr:DUF2071 domain-containing protein [Halomicroarcula sp. YJ-61-S]
MFSLTPLSATLGPVSFCHWPVDRASVAGSVPEWAAVETADDTAWVTAVGYTVESVRAFGRSVGGPTEVVTVQVPVRGPTDQRGAYPLAVFCQRGSLSNALSLFSFPIEPSAVDRSTVDGRLRRTVTVGGRHLLTAEHDTDLDAAATAPPDSLSGFLADRERYFLDSSPGGPLVCSVGQPTWKLRAGAGTCRQQLLSWLGLPTPETDPLVHASPGGSITLAPPVPAQFD